LNFDTKGTKKYRAPEILLCDSSHPFKGTEADIYALGILLYQMFFGVIDSIHNEKSTPSEKQNEKIVI
jgi:serine/threonine protein kinase